MSDEARTVPFVVEDAVNGSESGCLSHDHKPGDILGSRSHWRTRPWWKPWGPKVFMTLLVEVIQTERGMRIDVTEERAT